MTTLNHLENKKNGFFESARNEMIEIVEQVKRADQQMKLKGLLKDWCFAPDEEKAHIFQTIKEELLNSLPQGREVTDEERAYMVEKFRESTKAIKEYWTSEMRRTEGSDEMTDMMLYDMGEKILHLFEVCLEMLEQDKRPPEYVMAHYRMISFLSTLELKEKYLM